MHEIDDMDRGEAVSQAKEDIKEEIQEELRNNLSDSGDGLRIYRKYKHGRGGDYPVAKVGDIINLVLNIIN